MSDLLQALQGLMLNQGRGNAYQPSPFDDMGGNMPIMSPQTTAEGIRSLLSQIDSEQPGYLSFDPNQMQVSGGGMGGPQLPAQNASQSIPSSNGNISALVQEKLGAKEPQETNLAQSILSGRFDTSPGYDDFGAAIAKSAGGKNMSGQEVADSRNKDIFSTISTMQKLDNESRKLDYLTTSGAGTPAAIRLADEIQKARKAGDTQRVNDLVLSGKVFDKGVYVDPSTNQPAAMPNYGAALGTNEGGKKFGAERGSKAGAASVANDEASYAVTSINQGIENARSIAQQSDFTGRLAAPIGNLVGDPNYDRLKSQINRLVPAIRVASKFPAAGFSDADAARLESAIGNPNMRLDALLQVFNDVVSQGQQRQTLFSQQNQGYAKEFNYQNTNSNSFGGGNQQPSGQQGQAIDYREYFK